MQLKKLIKNIKEPLKFAVFQLFFTFDNRYYHQFDKLQGLTFSKYFSLSFWKPVVFLLSAWYSPVY